MANAYDAPCKGCAERYLGCHDRCPKYASFKKRCDDIREARKNHNQIYYASKTERYFHRLKGEL